MKLPANGAVIIRVDGKQEPVSPKNGTDFTLEELHAIVGGWIEVLYVGPYLMVLNEDGKRDKARNPAATNLVLTSLRVDDWISGDVLWCPRSMVK